MGIDKKKVLYISSADPLKGPGTIALSHVNALETGNYAVDFLTIYPVDGHPEFFYVLPRIKENPKQNRWVRRFKRLITGDLCVKEWIYRRKFTKIRSDLDTSLGCAALFYCKESEPPIRIKKVVKSLPSNDYDVVVVYFWQGLMTYNTVDAICQYMQNRPKLVFICADYSPMTGGCHFFGKCNGYKRGCGVCPMIRSNCENDFTAYNVKRRVYVNEKWNPVVMVNSYMKSFFAASKAMKGAVYAEGGLVMDLEMFKPIDKTEARRKLGIPQYKDRVLFFGAQNVDDPRKGITYLLKAINQLYDDCCEDLRSRTMILIGGRNGEEFIDKIPFESVSLGYMPVSDLPMVYSAATVYISPSIDDPGPSMVNQAIACGTPVIAFEIGVALDVVKNKGAGRCVSLYDSSAMACAIKEIFSMLPCEYNKLSFLSRKVAEEISSPAAFVKFFDEALNLKA